MNDHRTEFEFGTVISDALGTAKVGVYRRGSWGPVIWFSSPFYDENLAAAIKEAQTDRGDLSRWSDVSPRVTLKDN